MDGDPPQRSKLVKDQVTGTRGRSRGVARLGVFYSPVPGFPQYHCSEIPTLTQCSRSRHVGERYVGLLHEKVRDAMSPTFAELLIEFITATLPPL